MNRYSWHDHHCLKWVAACCLLLAVTPAQAFLDLIEAQRQAEEQQEQASTQGRRASDGKDGMAESEPGTPILTEAIAEIPGPKRVVAVGTFTSTGAFDAKYGRWDVGGGLAAMLATALHESQRFIVIERAQLQAILSEQQMRAQGVTSGIGPEVGRALGVQFLILGAVTEFGTDDEGGGFSLGLGGSGLGGLIGGLSRQSASGDVAIDFRIVDTTTGRIVQSFSERERIDDTSWDVSLGYQGVSIGSNRFLKTPLGRAARAVINRAVRRIALTVAEHDWQGLVVDYDQGAIYINAGSAAGVKKGDTFTIRRIVKRLTDPQTQEVLLVRTKDIGLAEIEETSPKISIGEFHALETDTPRRGDQAILVRDQR